MDAGVGVGQEPGSQRSSEKFLIMDMAWDFQEHRCFLSNLFDFRIQWIM